MSATRIRIIVMLVALAVIIVGVIITVSSLFSPVESASFGWFAYQPLANEVFMSGLGATNSMAVLGASITAVGLVALSFTLGWHLAVRKRPA